MFDGTSITVTKRDRFLAHLTKAPGNPHLILTKRVAPRLNSPAISEDGTGLFRLRSPSARIGLDYQKQDSEDTALVAKSG